MECMTLGPVSPSQALENQPPFLAFSGVILLWSFWGREK